MPAYGICLRVTHLRVHPDSVALYDVSDGVAWQGVFRKPGPIYIPFGRTVELVYSSTVAISFEIGSLREFIDQGLLFAEFVFGITAAAVLPSIFDEGILLTTTPTSIDFVGGGVTATTVGDDVTVTIPGGGAATSHALLLAPSLIWTASAHTGTASRIAGFDGAGATRYYQIGADLQAWDADLDALAALATTGVMVRTGPGTVTTRTITGTAGRIVVSDGDGVANPPTIDIGAAVGDVHGPGGGPGSSTDHALVRWDGNTGTLIQDSNVILTDAGDMTLTGGTILSVDNIVQATINNGVVVNGIRSYGKLGADPGVGPVATDGDTYYNTALRMPMTYDGLRTKWLSVESNEFIFGRNGPTAVGQYYRTVDGRVMSSTLGWYAIRSGTIVSLGYTRSNAVASTFELLRNGIVIATVGSAAINGRDITLNADFLFGDVLAVRNQNPGGVTQDVVGWFRVKWRV